MLLGRETRRLSDGHYYHVLALSNGEDYENAVFRVKVQNCTSLERSEVPLEAVQEEALREVAGRGEGVREVGGVVHFVDFNSNGQLVVKVD